MSNKHQPLVSVNEDPEDDEQSTFQPKCQCLCRFCLPRRYCVVLMTCWGLFNVYAMRVNLSVAIEPMSCQFNWNSVTEGIVLSAFFGGYLFGNIPGGWLAGRYGGKFIFGIGVLATSVLTIILPICTSGRLFNDNTLSCYCAHEDGWCFNKGNFTNKDSICTPIINNGTDCNADSYIFILIIVRFLMGIFESVTFPALYALLNYWTTDSERSRMIAITFAGMYLGNIVGFPLSSFIIASDSDIYGGWCNVFYFFSIMGIIWWLFWCILVSETPFNDGCISGKELIYLRDQLPAALTKKRHSIMNDADNKHYKVQWKPFFTHKAALVLYLSHFSYNWSFYTLLVELPTYLDDELDFDLSSAGFVSIMPYLSQFIVTILASILIDALIVNKCLSRVNARKIAQTLGTILPGILLVICGYLHNATYVVILLSTCTALMGFVNSGFAANYSDVSPTLSNVMFGIGNTIATIPGVVSPILSGWILQGKDKRSEWKIIFYIAFIIFSLGTSAFWIWSTGDKVDVLNKKETASVFNADNVKSIDVAAADTDYEYSDFSKSKFSTNKSMSSVMKRKHHSDCK